MDPRRHLLPARLDALRREILGYARGHGLDGFETRFEVLDVEALTAVAAYGGFPTRYPHWRFGMAYERLSKEAEWGLSRIYELVVNTDPAYAYLLESNMEVDQKLVMAHVFGHADFFRHNVAFAHTDRRMIDTMANHATRVRRHQDRHGAEAVEGFLDRCLSLENLIDPQAALVRRRPPRRPAATEDGEEDEAPPPQGPGPQREYMRAYLGPSGERKGARRRSEGEAGAGRALPERPERDVLLFLLEHAPLERWEQDLLGIVRAEAVYFSPQAQTKIMNEGWATFWHSRIMTTQAVRTPEVVDYAERHAGALSTAPGQLNPYRLGLALWRDIEHRWDTGRFGPAWEACDGLEARRAWDLGLGLGREKIFEVRRHYTDVSFVDEFLTPEFCARERLFAAGWDEPRGRWEVRAREFEAVKAQLLRGLTNAGQPIVEVVDANHENRGELLLRHCHDGVDLRLDWARDTLRQLQALWRRPVALATRVGGKGRLLRFDGREHDERPFER
ncbi:MAG: SpoVR family protein [Anaeromyxobacteraceae bacterium]|nr:SpoVR family protein [Anaeromyxobacteraceae bacterium]